MSVFLNYVISQQNIIYKSTSSNLITYKSNVDYFVDDSERKVGRITNCELQRIKKKQVKLKSIFAKNFQASIKFYLTLDSLIYIMKHVFVFKLTPFDSTRFRQCYVIITGWIG